MGAGQTSHCRGHAGAQGTQAYVKCYRSAMTTWSSTRYSVGRWAGSDFALSPHLPHINPFSTGVLRRAVRSLTLFAHRHDRHTRIYHVSNRYHTSLPA
jgi:hypothetical protein